MTENKKESAEKKVAKTQAIITYLTDSLQGEAMAPAAYQDEIESKWSKLTAEEKQAQLTTLQAELSEAQGAVDNWTKRFSKYKIENERRRHNYVPLIFELLHQLGKKNML